LAAATAALGTIKHQHLAAQVAEQAEIVRQLQQEQPAPQVWDTLAAACLFPVQEIVHMAVAAVVEQAALEKTMLKTQVLELLELDTTVMAAMEFTTLLKVT
jgi:hypothetical protein